MIRWLEDRYDRFVVCGCFKHEWRTCGIGNNLESKVMCQCKKCGKLEVRDQDKLHDAYIKFKLED